MIFEKYPLSELAKIKYGKNQAQVVCEKSDYPILGTGGFMGYALRPLYSKPSVLIGRKGTIGKVKYIDQPFWTVDTLFYTEINEQKVLPHFLYYVMSQIDFNVYNEGTTIPSLRTETLNRIELLVPPLENQKQILAILESLDNKIANNNAINNNLQAQAEALFKAWFVEYLPFGGVKPENWTPNTLGSIVEISSGKRPCEKKSEKSQEFSVPLVGAASIMGYTNAILYDEKILITGRVGTHGIIQRFSNKCWASDNTLVIKTRYYEFVYQFLKNVDFNSMNRGSTQPLITQTDLKKLPLILPSQSALEQFESIVGGLMATYENNVIENDRLSALRDTLLPRLMSGEIDVSGVQI